jgi:membrane associated rhomboid family serine protease
VFGALGLLTGLGIRFAWLGHRQRRPLYAPLGGGVILLAWLGTGGPNTDLLGHLCGFLTGVILGWFCSRHQDRAPLAGSPPPSA